MTIEQMRQALLKVYPGRNWQQKITRASDDQVFAIFTRLRNAGKV